MTTSSHARSLRFALFLLIAVVTTPICGAAQQPSEHERKGATTQRHVARETAWLAAPAIDQTPYPLIAQLGTMTIGEHAPLLLLARADESPSLGAPLPATATSRDDPAMGLPLPEPGPLSAIIATVALAAFFFIRRAP